MNETSTVKSYAEEANAPNKSNPMRLFYTVAAAVLLAVTFIGFQQFYLHGRAVGDRPIPPKAQLLTVIHGVTMSAWIILFLIQPWLIVSGNRRQHIILGRVGAILALAIIGIGVFMAIHSVRVSPHDGLFHGLTQNQFLAIPLTDIAKFAIFVTIGVLARRRAEIHRPMMLLATLSLATAAAARIGALTRPYYETFLDNLFGPLLPILVLGGLFLVAQRLLAHRFDRYYALGFAGLVVTAPLIMSLARTEAWGRFAAFLVG